MDNAGTLACLDGYMNIAMEQTEVREKEEQRYVFSLLNASSSAL